MSKPKAPLPPLNVRTGGLGAFLEDGVTFPAEVTEECGAELELESPWGGRPGVTWLFICRRAKGHELVHIDNSHARANGAPTWSMVWS